MITLESLVFLGLFLSCLETLLIRFANQIFKTEFSTQIFVWKHPLMIFVSIVAIGIYSYFLFSYIIVPNLHRDVFQSNFLKAFLGLTTLLLLALLILLHLLTLINKLRKKEEDYPHQKIYERVVAKLLSGHKEPVTHEEPEEAILNEKMEAREEELELENAYEEEASLINEDEKLPIPSRKILCLALTKKIFMEPFEYFIKKCIKKIHSLKKSL